MKAHRTKTKIVTPCHGVIGGVTETPPDTGPGMMVVIHKVIHLFSPGHFPKPARPPNGKKQFTVAEIIRFIAIAVVILHLLNR